MPREDVHTFCTRASDIVISEALTAEGRTRILDLAEGTVPDQLASFVATLTKKQLLDDHVPIQDKQRKQVVWEEQEDALIRQGRKD